MEATRVTTAPGRGGSRAGRAVELAGFDEFVAACSTRLLTAAYMLTHDHGKAEDLLQTALAKTWVSWSRIDSDPEAYTRKVLFNTYASWWQRRWNQERPTRVLPESGYSQDLSEAQDLWAALGRLPRGMRAVVVLRYFEDLSETQTAALLECSVGTVKSQHAKALAKLRADGVLLADEGPATREDADR